MVHRPRVVLHDSLGCWSCPLLMSMPSIPGYTDRPNRDTLADLWQRPAGDYPSGLWLKDDLLTVTANPTGWLTVAEHFFTEAKHGGRGCVLVDVEHAAAALESTTWLGHDLGKFGVWDSGQIDSGLSMVDRGIDVEFFIHARQPAGAAAPVIEISLPFLWYWDAVPTGARADLDAWTRSSAKPAARFSNLAARGSRWSSRPRTVSLQKGSSAKFEA